MVIFEYSLLFLHFLFYVFFCMMLSAFIYTSTKSLSLKYFSIILVVAIAVIDIYFVRSNFFSKNFILKYWIVGAGASLVFAIVMKIFRKLDLMVWIPFSILFSPFVAIISVIFLLIVSKKILSIYSKNLAYRTKIFHNFFKN